jgi:hypothetical protein
MKNPLFVLILSVFSFSNFANAQENKENEEYTDSVYKNGDIIFIKNRQLEGNNLIPTGKTKYTYTGIIFLEGEQPYVYFAAEPVKKLPLNEFLKFTVDNKHVIKRLIDQSLLTSDALATMKSFANAKLGQHYDNQLKLSNDELYNAEFVWKIYKSCVGLPLSMPKELQEYKIDQEVNKEFLTEIYGPAILTEKMVAIGDIYRSNYVQ